MSASPQVRSEQYRQSNGLEQFFSTLGPDHGLHVLDLGEFTQANVGYITGLGHRLHFEDILQALADVFGPGDPAITQDDPAKMRRLLDQVLHFPPNYFDAILVWDTLEHLSKPLLGQVMERLRIILRPRGGLLACFHAEPKDNLVQTFSFRIADSRTLLLQPRGPRKPAQWFNNRTIERLFQGFSSVKFFLTRDSIREVIVRK